MTAIGLPFLERAGLRVALAFTCAFVAAEMHGLNASFIAGLVAAAISFSRPLPLPLLCALPLVMWGLLAAAGIAAHGLAETPLVLAALLLAVFYLGFRLSMRARFESIGLVTLASFAVLPDMLVATPELARDIARWGAANAGIGCLCAFVASLMFPGSDAAGAAPGGGTTAAAQGETLTPPVPPLIAAAALLVAVMMVVAFQPPGPNAVLIGAILALRADASPPALVIRNRVMAALAGGAAALAIWIVIGHAQSPLVLAACVMLAAWLIVGGRMEDPQGRDLAKKTLNVVAVLLGKGMSFYLDPTDVLLWPRLAGVALGVSYALVVLLLFARTTPEDARIRA